MLKGARIQANQSIRDGVSQQEQLKEIEQEVQNQTLVQGEVETSTRLREKDKILFERWKKAFFLYLSFEVDVSEPSTYLS